LFNNRPGINKIAEGDKTRKITTGSLVQTEELAQDAFWIREKIQEKLIADFDSDQDLASIEEIRPQIENYFNQVLQEENRFYKISVRNFLLEWVVSDILGYGPLEPLLADPAITEIMVNGLTQVYVEKFGKIEEANAVFKDVGHIMRIIDRIVAPLGRRLDEGSPMVDARLPNGYRVNATIPPLSLDGPILTIRKFSQTPFTAQDLIANVTLTAEAVEFLRATVKSKVNIVISGGTGSGKTTLLNVISVFIPEAERIITIEDTAELQLKQKHVIRLEKRPPNVEGQGEITIRQLVINALRMRPDRIIVGECRSGEALDMLQAMNTGHDGSMTTIHANTPRDALRRIEVMVMMAGMELPLKAIREQIAASIELVVHVDRMNDGSRRVVQITEVQGMEGDTIVMQDIFKFNLKEIVNGKVLGKLETLGIRPKLLEKLTESGIELPLEIFQTGETGA
jgi:pilus assembly protein CpaF